ncbi:MAG TPA: YbdD/YjiX family protein [Gemmatimonadales bacterium]|nr:YbdD/YjiX family protein [Gemmatimonadales bacterium]
MRGRGDVRNVGNRAAVEAAEGDEGKAKRRTAKRSTVPSFLSFRTFLTFLRRIAGMPDYRAHVEHLRRCHPESPIPSEREFFEDYLQRRYQNGATRCC